MPVTPYHVGPGALLKAIAPRAISLTALPDWEAAFERLFEMLRLGGRFVLFDVYAAERTTETRAVELVARADPSREAWRPLEARCADFSREILPANPKTFGGDLYVASGTKAGGRESAPLEREVG